MSTTDGTTEPQPTPAPKKRTWPLLVGVVGAVIAAVVIASLIFAPSQEDDAIAACERAVSAQMKSPSTASFPNTSAVKVDGDAYNVRGSVDAQNSFGATVRTSFVCRNIERPYVTADDVTVD